MTNAATETKKPQTTDAARTPIRIAKLLFTSPNPHGVKLPEGLDGANERIVPNLTAGVQGETKIEIEHLPWMRVFRITKTRKVSRSGEGKNAPEVVTWEPMGRPFHVPDTWAVSIPVAE